MMDLGPNYPHGFEWNDPAYGWLQRFASGWQFGESGVLVAIVERLVAKGVLTWPVTCCEVGAGDGAKLPVTLEPLIRRGARASLFEADHVSRKALDVRFPGPEVAIYGTYSSAHRETLVAGVLVIDVDGHDWRILQDATQAQWPAMPLVVMCEHADRNGEQPETLPQDGKQQATHQQLAGIGRQDFDQIGINAINSLFVRKDIAHLLKEETK